MSCLYLNFSFLSKVVIFSVVFIRFIKDSSSSTDINCIILKHCPMALKLVESKRNDPATIKFLRFTHCGFKGREPMVWCNMFDKCKTPDGEDGSCVSVRKCKPFIDLITQLDVSNNTNEKYLKDFRCSTVYDPDIKVCCTNTEELVEVDVEKIDMIEKPTFEDRFSNSLPNPHLQECGKQNSDNRIYGGVEADLDEFPWMALVRYQQNGGNLIYGCGGSLIHSRFVLTAGHCLDTIVMKSKGLAKIHRIVLGEYDIRNKTDCFYNKYGTDCADPVQEIQVESTKIHPGYMSGYADHDIGIVKLMWKVGFTDYIRPICLPSANLQLTKKDIYMISGWGKTPEEKGSPVKRKARIEIVEREKCNEFAEAPLDNSKICAGGTGDGVDACSGDSGGPLMLGRNLNNNYINFVIGIVSYGFGRTCGERPGVYTYVPYYVEWIQSSLVF
ncbi:hypothetical protein WA026_014394 [Henosepilachna vigintioctopunctata]|uniref:CLIP domain-containing serine protease n=1 Tax=Henosepilachna vigintioctopunctata TaxID=420089 RepID=A0AAW1UEV3_9CUCU